MRTRSWIFGCAAMLFGFVAACELATSFDRSKIPDESDASLADGGATDDATVSPDAPLAADSCADDASRDGAYVCPPIGSIDAGSFAPSNFDPTAIDAAAIGDIDVSDDAGCQFDTNALTLACAHQSFVYSVTSVDQDGGPQLAVFATGAFTIEPGVVVDAWGARPLVIYAQGPIDIEGELRASGSLSIHTPPAGNLPSGSLDPGPATVKGSQGGAGYCGRAGNGGPTYGSPTLVPLVGGSSSDYFAASDQSRNYLWGGAGGGAIAVVSRTSVSVGPAGLINANGESGSLVEVFNMDQLVGTGGASGGAIVIEAPRVSVTGDLAANGGGGVLSFATNATPSQAAAAGRGVAQDIACSVDGGGGAGSAGDDRNGQPGTACEPGGGAGWIAVRAGQCSFVGSVMSPSLKSGCANVLPLAH